MNRHMWTRFQRRVFFRTCYLPFSLFGKAVLFFLVVWQCVAWISGDEALLLGVELWVWILGVVTILSLTWAACDRYYRRGINRGR